MQYEQREFSLGDYRQKKVKKGQKLSPGEWRRPKFIRANFELEPLAPGVVVTARINLPALGLVKNTPYKIISSDLKPQMINCGFLRYFYSIDGKTCNILLDYIQIAGPVCKI